MADLPLTVAEAQLLLDCRAGACRAEVQAAFRRVVWQLRPDLGQLPGGQMRRLEAARDLLLLGAGPDRRRWRRTQGERRPLRQVLPLRRSTWRIPDEPIRSLDREL